MPIYFDATFSWSGYSYQGKVGMFIVLKKLNEYRGNHVENHFKNWSLEFEWLEDFSIKVNKIYLSLHQVKTLKDRNVNDYKKAIKQTIYNGRNALLYEVIPYFHVSSKVDNPDNIFYNYTINGTNQKFCPLDKIDDLLKEEIKIFLNSYNKPDYNGSCEDAHFFKLLAIIDNHVRIRHENIQRVGRNVPPSEIEFSIIINSLKTNSNQFTNERMIYEKKAYISSVLDKFLQNKSDEVKGKLNQLLIESCGLNLDFVKYSKSISPHVFSIYNNEMSISNFQELLNGESLKGVFFKIIESIEIDYLWQEYKIIYQKEIEDINKIFLPTSINRDEDDCGEVSADILMNPHAVEDLYEIDYFITGRINCNSIEDEANNYTEIRDEDLPDVENKEHKINELKRVKMIDRNEAERILNA